MATNIGCLMGGVGVPVRGDGRREQVWERECDWVCADSDWCYIRGWLHTEIESVHRGLCDIARYENFKFTRIHLVQYFTLP